jgi:hypothetical protein
VLALSVLTMRGALDAEIQGQAFHNLRCLHLK